MALSHHRKLLLTESDDSINATLLCKPLCDPLLNTSGYCFYSCLDICPTVCHYPFPAAIPPPEYSVFYDADSPPNSRAISPLLITIFAALTLTILLIGVFMVFKYLRRRSITRRSIIQSQRAAPPPDDEEFLEQGPVLDHPIWYIRTVGLPPSLISKISVCKYKNGDGLVEGTECSVCLTEFEEDETLRLLPKCSHAFHVSCIDTWLRSHTNCPNCRAPIFTNMDPSRSPEPITGNLQVITLDDEEDSDDGRLSREIESTSQDVVTETQVEVEADGSEDDRSRNAHVVEEEVDSSNMLPIRRSVSVDSLSASKIGLAIADFLALRRLESNSDEIEKDKIRLGEEDQRDNNYSSSSSSSTGSSSSIKRSLSLSGRFFLSKYSLSRSSVLPR